MPRPALESACPRAAGLIQPGVEVSPLLWPVDAAIPPSRADPHEGKIVAFETQCDTSGRYSVRATWVFFEDLPEIILCSVRSLQNPEPGQPFIQTTTRMQSYAQTALETYNGMRIWGDDPSGVTLTHAPNRTHIDATELDRIIDRNWDPPVSAGVRLVSVIDDSMQHAGQALYLRGMIGRRG